MAKAKSAAFLSSASRCANGCSASPRTPNACCKISTRLTGAIRSRKCSGTGLGRSEGAEVDFQSCWLATKQSASSPRVRTRLFGATYMVLAPEHKLVGSNHDARTARRSRDTISASPPRARAISNAPNSRRKRPACSPALMRSIRSTAKKFRSGLRTTCSRAYGTGAIMAVPAHDERDLEFATRNFNLPRSVQVVQADPELGQRSLDLDKDFVRTMAVSCATSASQKSHSTACRRPKPKRKSPPGSRKKVSAKRPSITNCATGCSAGSVTGASRSRLFGNEAPDGNLYHEALPESALPVLPPTLDDYKPTPTASRRWRARRIG